jgi:hypothetical protein
MTTQRSPKQNPRHVNVGLDIHVIEGSICSGMLTSNLDLAEALEYAHLLLSNNPAREAVAIDYYEQCALCADSGRISKPRSRTMYATTTCPECNGNGHAHTERLSITRR